ncbi:MAG: helix-turn-helix transcriptional regulator [Clostridia bacterium]|nr:helix-turn-helix transcriptional regulator [Clostridia bacterium]
MQKLGYSIRLSDIRLNLTAWRDGFRLSDKTSSRSLPAQLKLIHTHNDFEIFFVSDATLVLHTIDGTHAYTDSLVIIPPRLEHYVTLENLVCGHYMYFSIEKSNAAESKQFDALSSTLNHGVIALEMSDDERFYTSHIDRALSDSASTETLPHLFALLFSECFSRLAPVQSSSPLTKSGSYANTIDLYISEHYAQPIRLSDLAQELFLSVKQVSRILQKEYGCSFSELLNRHRLSAACMLLRYTELEIAEIAAQVGYEYENYFYTVFRKAYGITPKQYRQSDTAQAKT